MGADGCYSYEKLGRLLTKRSRAGLGSRPLVSTDCASSLPNRRYVTDLQAKYARRIAALEAVRPSLLVPLAAPISDWAGLKANDMNATAAQASREEMRVRVYTPESALRNPGRL